MSISVNMDYVQLRLDLDRDVSSVRTGRSLFHMTVLDRIINPEVSG